MKRISAERLAAVSVCLFASGAVLFLFFRYLLAGFLPFLIAFGISLLLRPIARRFSGSQKGFTVLSLLLTVCFFLIVGVLIRLLVLRLLRELNGLPDLLLQLEARLTASESLPMRFQNKLSRLGKIGEQIHASLSTLPQKIAEKLTEFAAVLAGKIIKTAPDLLLSTVVTVVATFFFTLPSESVFDSLTGLLPVRMQERALHLQDRFKTISFRYAKAYLLILLVTFVELFFGLSVLGVKYALLLAAATSLIDILPILGVGTVLIPYAVISFLGKNVALGVGLLILYAVILVVRQIMEPRLVGKSLGLHPLLTLFAGYLGYRLFGFAGMICAPLFLTVGRQIARGFPQSR